MPDNPATVPKLVDMSADALKARFKPKCVALGTAHKNWQVRVHRAISWLRRAGEFGTDQQPEARFLYLWIALNALYSRWNAERNMPDGDGASRVDFFRQLCDWNGPAFEGLMRQQRGLAKKILQNPYIAFVFWKNPDHPKARGWATEDANYLDRNLKNGDFCKVVEQVMDRLFVLRGQIVHGASTGGSRLNRTSLATALKFLEVFVPLAIHIAVEHGANDDWPELCYRPVE